MTEAITQFNDVSYAPLRIFNRCVMLFNINEDQGYEAAQAYLKGFTQADKSEMLAVYNRVKKEGVDTVRRELIRTMPLPEEEEIVYG